MEWQHCFCAGGLWRKSGPVCSLSPCHAEGNSFVCTERWMKCWRKRACGWCLNTCGTVYVCMRVCVCVCVCVCVRKSLLSQWPVSSLVSQSCAVWTSFHGSDKHTSLIWPIHIQTALTPSFNMHLQVVMSSARTQARIQNAPAKPCLTHFWTQICPLVFQVLILPLIKTQGRPGASALY